AGCGTLHAKVPVEYVLPLALERAATNESTPAGTAVDLARLANDIRTYNVRVDRFYAAMETGCSQANQARLQAAIRNLVTSGRALQNNIETQLRQFL
ncbi:MAG TPA: hypothetical protein VHL59_11245, partial [Thermoanaerobaculia bacterium]|nr:hypothetical protein [Thermoanaerobaculia bacterium]